MPRNIPTPKSSKAGTVITRKTSAQITQALAGGLWIGLMFLTGSAHAQSTETPEQVRQRLELYRQREIDAEKRKKRAQMEAAERKRKAEQEAAEKKRQQHMRTWKTYGDIEVNWVAWRREKDQTWSTAAQALTNNAGSHSESFGVVRFGDTLVKLSNRYGLTLQELLRLNPGIETTRLVAGTQVRLAATSPTRPLMIVGPKSSSATGVNWPDLPDFGGAKSGNSLPLQALDHRIAVNCGSLLVNQKLPFENWGTWNRPRAGSPLEQLIIDFCSSIGDSKTRTQ